MAPENDQLARFIELCKRIYQRMERDGTWPWEEEPDSLNPERVVESEDSSQSNV